MIDLRGCLEEEIRQFLDNRLSVNYLKEQTTSTRIEDSAGFSRDFEEELFSALQKHDVYQAKKVLHDVRDEFSTYPVGSAERKQLEAILRSLYEKFREYIETENTLNKLDEGISHVDDPHYLENATKEEVIDGSIPQPILSSKEDVSQTQTTNTSSSHKQNNSFEDQLLKVLPKLKSAAHDDLSAARRLYAQAKQFYSQLPNQKKKLYQQQLLAVYKILTQQEKQPNNAQEKKVIASRKPEQESYAHKQFIQSLQELQQAINDKQLTKVKQSYSDLKVNFLSLSEEEKNKHEETIALLHEQILPLFKQEANDEQPLQQTPQKQQETTLDPEKSKLYTVEKRLRKAIDKGELHEAMIHYEELRDLIHNLPQQQQHEHVPRAHAYYDWLMKAWKQYQITHPTINKHEQRLTGRP